ncbi:hypothetical protein KQH27_00635 [bacterium]|nr:hypothetical protein [bacterium]
MILIPTKGPEDWKNLLADPDLHWKAGYSAYALAHRWEEAKGFPGEIKEALELVPALADVELLLAIPEYKVSLPGGGAASQNDIFCLARNRHGLVIIMVEGKVNEPFGPLVSEWFVDPSPGKVKRLNFLCRTLGLDKDQVQGVRYQLLHRTASAILEAKRFKALTAAILIHSFSPTYTWFEDYAAFADLFGTYASMDQVHTAGKIGGTDLYLAWVKG